MRLFFLTVSFMILSWSGESFAWGWEGHKLICGLAEEKLTLEAKRMVNTLLEESADLKGGVSSFPESCLWPDEAKFSTRKSTYEHHFINVPDNAMEIDLSRDCAATNCIAVGVQQSLTYLTRDVDGKRDTTRRAASLRFLGHYIGDLHQPLHIGNASDWGGNKVVVRWRGKKSNLHAIWDYEMLDDMGFRYPDSLKFLRSIKPGGTESNVAAWMNESLALARSNAYVDSTGVIISSGSKLGAPYLNRNKPIVIDRIAHAGARLAQLLNSIAAGRKPVAFVVLPVD